MSGSNGAIIGAPNLALIGAITQFANGTQAVWNDITIPIPYGLVVYAIDTTAVKIGDGATLYVNLPVVFTLNSIITLAQQVASDTSTLQSQIQTYLTTQLTGYVSNAGLTETLAGYATIAGLATTLGGYVSNAGFSAAFAAMFVTANTSQTMMTGHTYYIDSTSGSFNLTFPATPTLDSVITIVDIGHNLTSHPVTLMRNGGVGTIENIAEDCILNLNGLYLILSYNNGNWSIQ